MSVAAWWGGQSLGFAASVGWEPALFSVWKLGRTSGIIWYKTTSGEKTETQSKLVAAPSSQRVELNKKPGLVTPIQCHIYHQNYRSLFSPVNKPEDVETSSLENEDDANSEKSKTQRVISIDTFLSTWIQLCLKQVIHGLLNYRSKHCAYHRYSRIQVDGAAAISNVAGHHDRGKQNLEKATLALKASVQDGYRLLLLTFHWPKQVTWPSLTSKGRKGNPAVFPEGSAPLTPRCHGYFVTG
uniref:uncharacterized protein LOC118152033 n=1 Tax=Callithrix jacchus TaxID=9483 RepID=UPI0023DD4AB8|nr:uncharacterized protein LOC118152033 [Callithrix jacchus]